MSTAYFDEVMDPNEACYIFLGRSHAGAMDILRLKRLFPRAGYITRSTGFFFAIRTIRKSKAAVFIHSSPYNLVLLLLMRRRNRFLIVHNQPGHLSREGFAGFLDALILRSNMLLMGGLIFLTEHVMLEYAGYSSLHILTRKCFVRRASKARIAGRTQTVFFFGRYLPYKGIDRFVGASRLFQGTDFYIYSFKAPYYSGGNLHVENGWIKDEDVCSIYERHDVLFLPYSEVSQSGPLYLALEHGCTVLLPRIDGFSQYSTFPNVFFYDPGAIGGDITMLSKILGQPVRIYGQ